MMLRATAEIHMTCVVLCAVAGATLNPAALDAQGSTEIDSGPACSACSVTLLPVAVLGHDSGPGMLESEFNMVRIDSQGRYFVHSDVSPFFWVFSADGRSVERVGRRGEGPGEFDAISGILISPHDSIFVIDNALDRISVYSPDLDFIRTARLELDGGHRVVSVDDRLVFNSMVRSPERIGYPLHLVTPDGEIVRSFGSQDGLYRPDLRDVLEVREVSGAGNSIWSMWLNQYVLEEWGVDGQLRRVLTRDADWFPTWWQRQSELDEPPTPITSAIQSAADTLWVVVRVPGQEWRSAVRQVPGERFIRIDNFDLYQDSYIEAVDITNSIVIAAARLPEAIMGFAGPGLVFGSAIDPAGNPIIPVWKISIGLPQGRN